ncbi:unnamed protein product, partial [Vitis vinifera]
MVKLIQNYIGNFLKIFVMAKFINSKHNHIPYKQWGTRDYSVVAILFMVRFCQQFSSTWFKKRELGILIKISINEKSEMEERKRDRSVQRGGRHAKFSEKRNRAFRSVELEFYGVIIAIFNNIIKIPSLGDLENMS